MAEKDNPTTVLEAFAEIVRSAVRPAVTIIFSAVIAQAVVERIDLPQWFLALAIPIITWWFAERTVTHIQQKKDDD